MKLPQTFSKKASLVERQPMYRMGLANEPIKQAASAQTPAPQLQRSWLGTDFSHVVVKR